MKYNFLFEKEISDQFIFKIKAMEEKTKQNEENDNRSIDDWKKIMDGVDCAGPKVDLFKENPEDETEDDTNETWKINLFEE